MVSRAVLFGCLLLAACSLQTPTIRSTPTTFPPIVSPSPTLTLAPAPTSASALSTRIPLPASAKAAIQTPAWFDDAVLYEIFPRSFADANGDGIGDLRGVTAKLDYLQSLGVSAIWLTPIFASPSYHGYDTTDYYQINPDFGTDQDLIAMVEAAHQRNIQVILDLVAGHTSDEHPFFKDAYGNPKSNYANWYRWLNEEHTAYQHFGAATDMPRLNQDNPETRDYLIDVAKYWMARAKIDGYRLDSATGASHAFWKAFRREIKALNPDALLLGEVWDSALKIAPYYEDQFDATYDFPVYFDLMGAHDRAGSSALIGAYAPTNFQSTLRAESRLYPPGAQSVRFLNHHDTLRVMSQVIVPCQVSAAQCQTERMQRAKLAATWLFTLPGTPMIYYGEEIGMRGDKSDGDKTVREPMDWYASETGAGMTAWYKPDARFNAPNDGISVEEQLAQKDSLLEHYRALIALRNAFQALQTGEFIPLTVKDNPKVVTYLRRQPHGDTLLILLNFDTEPTKITLDFGALGWGDETLYFDNIFSGEIAPKPQPASQYSLELAPLSGNILQLD